MLLLLFSSVIFHLTTCNLGMYIFASFVMFSFCKSKVMFFSNWIIYEINCIKLDEVITVRNVDVTR